MTLVEPGPGHNNPPALTPYEAVEQKINDLYGEAKLWLDGAQVDNQELADGIGNLMGMLRAAEKEADAARIVEKTPFDEQIAEIQSRYAPLIADTKSLKGKTTLAIAACKRALQPWLDKVDAELRESARLAREEAEAKTRAAQEAIRAAAPENLEAREQAEILIRDAKKAEITANIAGRQTAKAGGMNGRAAALRTTWVAGMTDEVAASRHYWAKAREEILRVVQGLADRDVRAGKRTIPGFEITEQRTTV